MNKHLRTLGLGFLVAGLSVAMISCGGSATKSQDKVVIEYTHDHTAEYAEAALVAWSEEEVAVVLDVVKDHYMQGDYDYLYSATELAMIKEEVAAGSEDVYISILNDLLQDAADEGSEAAVSAYLAENFAPELVEVIQEGLYLYIETVAMMEVE